jgi:hypothetical protein
MIGYGNMDEQEYDMYLTRRIKCGIRLWYAMVSSSTTYNKHENKQNDNLCLVSNNLNKEYDQRRFLDQKHG